MKNIVDILEIAGGLLIGGFGVGGSEPCRELRGSRATPRVSEGPDGRRRTLRGRPGLGEEEPMKRMMLIS